MNATSRAVLILCVTSLNTCDASISHQILQSSHNAPNFKSPFHIDTSHSMASSSKQVLASFGLSQQKIAQFCASLCQDAKSILFTKLLYAETSIDLSAMNDNLEDGKGSLMERNSEQLQPPTRITDIAANYRQLCDNLDVAPSKIAYRKNMEAFLELMLVLFLFTGGQPDQGVSVFRCLPSDIARFNVKSSPLSATCDVRD